MSIPNALFGGAMIGNTFTTPEQVQELLDQLKVLQIDHIDTAARYPPGNPGRSENLLGEVRALEQGFTIDTKISPGSSSGDGSGTHTAPAIRKSLEESLDQLKTKKVNVLYFHRPDPSTPIAEQAAEINRQYLDGYFERVSISHPTTQDYFWLEASLGYQISHLRWSQISSPSVENKAMSSRASTKVSTISSAERVRSFSHSFAGMGLHSMPIGMWLLIYCLYPI